MKKTTQKSFFSFYFRIKNNILHSPNPLTPNPEWSPLSALEWLHLIILIISNAKKIIMSPRAEQTRKWEGLSSLGAQRCW